MKQIIAVIIASFLLAACVPSNHPSPPPLEDKLSEIQARGTLVIATDADYLPQSQLLPGTLPNPDTKCEPSQYTANQFAGFEAELGMLLARQLGVEPCFVTPPWNQLVTGNWGDNWDIHLGSVAITNERMHSLYFSQPYYASPIVVLLHEENAAVKTAEDLSGQRIGVCAGCTFEAYLQSTLQIPGEAIPYRIHKAQIVAYESDELGINDLVAGEGLDAVITMLPKAQDAIQTGKPLKIMESPLWFEYSSVTVDRASRRDPLRLLDTLSRLIQDMHRNGTLKELSLKYHGVDLTQEAARFDLLSLHQTP